MITAVSRKSPELLSLAVVNCTHEHHKITQGSVKVLAREDSWFETVGHESQPGIRAPPIYDELLLSCNRIQFTHMTSED